METEKLDIEKQYRTGQFAVLWVGLCVCDWTFSLCNEKSGFLDLGEKKYYYKNY
jgi:hypothetical protein